MAGLILFGLTLFSRSQDVPPLEFTMKGDSLAFQLNSFDRAESWMLQQSSDGESWTDLVPLEGGLGILGFGVQIDRSSLQGGNLDKVFFRAKKVFRHEELSQEYLAALARWNEAGVSSYTHVVQSWAGMNSYSARYTVVDGVVTKVETIVDPMFGSVPASVAIEQNAHLIDVDWNAGLGFPERGYIDYDDWIADEERGWTISELIPLE
jgi:hypothetical protein